MVKCKPPLAQASACAISNLPDHFSLAFVGVAREKQGWFTNKRDEKRYPCWRKRPPIWRKHPLVLSLIFHLIEIFYSMVSVSTSETLALGILQKF
jgi:hypothetical protein